MPLSMLVAMHLLGCGDPAVPVGEADAQRVSLAVFEADPLVVGELAELRVVAAPAFAQVRFYRSDAGLGAGPCHAVFGVCSGLLEPLVLVGQATADASGTAAISVTLPADAPPVAYMQAFMSKNGQVVATNTLAVDVGSGVDTGGDTAAVPPTCDLIVSGPEGILGCTTTVPGELPGVRIEFPPQSTSFTYPASTTFLYDLVKDVDLPCVAPMALDTDRCYLGGELAVSQWIDGTSADGVGWYSCENASCVSESLCANWEPAKALYAGVVPASRYWDGRDHEIYGWDEPAPVGDLFPVGSYAFNVRYAGWIPDPVDPDVCLSYDHTWSLPFEIVEPPP